MNRHSDVLKGPDPGKSTLPKYTNIYVCVLLSGWCVGVAGWFQVLGRSFAGVVGWLGCCGGWVFPGAGWVCGWGGGVAGVMGWLGG